MLKAAIGPLLTLNTCVVVHATSVLESLLESHAQLLVNHRLHKPLIVAYVATACTRMYQRSRS